MWKLRTGDLVMINKAPEDFDHLNGIVVKLTQASLLDRFECWYTEEHESFYLFWDLAGYPIPEEWMFKFEKESEDV